MIRNLKRVVLVVGGVVQIVHAQIISQPTLTAWDVQVFCQESQPYVSFVLPLNAADRGRPGLTYIGMHDPAGSSAMLLQGGNWIPFQSGLFSVYAIANAGLTDQRISLPLNNYLAGGGWKLYAGYGALSAEADGRVQGYTETVQKSEQISGRKINRVDPDHFRRSLIQDDMVRRGKYTYINTGVENNQRFCQPEYY